MVYPLYQKANITRDFSLLVIPGGTHISQNTAKTLPKQNGSKNLVSVALLSECLTLHLTLFRALLKLKAGHLRSN